MMYNDAIRRKEIGRIRAALERDGYARLQMSLLIGATGAVGFVTSYIMLHAGLTEMWVRYVLAFGMSYCVFLLLLWMWLRTRPEEYVDVVDVIPSPSNAQCTSIPSGQGGSFGGAGASDSKELALEGNSAAADISKPFTDSLSAAAEAEEFAIPLVAMVLVVAAIVAVFLSSVWIIYSAPVLFAELIFDGVLAAALYKRLPLSSHTGRHWLLTAIRHTCLPFFLCTVVAGGAGMLMQHYVPGAKSIGEVFTHIRD